MKYIRQFAIILTISFIGEGCHFFIPLPIPASIYGLLILLFALRAGIVRVESVQDVGRFLVEIMPLMFIPAAVGLMETWPLLEPVFVPFLVILVVSTILVMAVTGWCTQGILRLEEKKKKESRTYE